MQMGEWNEVIIGDHIDLISGFAFKSTNFLNNLQEGALPVIKIKNVANGDTNVNDVVFHMYDDSLKRFLIRKGDVLIAMTGNHPHALTQVVGDVSRYKLSVTSLLNQRVGKLVSKGDACLDFIYYLFKDKGVQFYLANQSSGSANQANISKSDILGLNLKIPSPSEQKSIASILSSLDVKIDLLHRQNTTLEKMAETLSAQERAVFLLREVFGLDYNEIASVVGQTAGHCRQIAHRARQRIQKDSPPRFDTSTEARDKLMEQFRSAIDSGDIERLKTTLADDITVYSDGGGKVAAARKSFGGLHKVAKFLSVVHKKYMASFDVREAMLNNEPGLVFSLNGTIQAAWSIHIEDDRIKNLFIVLNPEKLSGISQD